MGVSWDIVRRAMAPTPDHSARVFGMLDLLFAALYAGIGFWLAPSHRYLFPCVVALICVLLAGAGVGLLLGTRWGRRLAAVASWVLLAGCALVIGGLVMSSAYLSGVYGGFGKGVALVCLLFAAMVIQLAGLLPLFQLRFLRRTAVEGRDQP